MAAVVSVTPMALDNGAPHGNSAPAAAAATSKALEAPVGMGAMICRPANMWSKDDWGTRGTVVSGSTPEQFTKDIRRLWDEYEAKRKRGASAPFYIVISSKDFMRMGEEAAKLCFDTIGLQFHTGAKETNLLHFYKPVEGGADKDKVPTGPTITGGVGIILISSKDEMLLVKEGILKAPTESLDAGEFFGAAAMRGIAEEVGGGNLIDTKIPRVLMPGFQTIDVHGAQKTVGVKQTNKFEWVVLHLLPGAEQKLAADGIELLNTADFEWINKQKAVQLLETCVPNPVSSEHTPQIIVPQYDSNGEIVCEVRPDGKKIPVGKRYSKRALLTFLAYFAGHGFVEHISADGKSVYYTPRGFLPPVSLLSKV
jgi:hypothetical protein